MDTNLFYSNNPADWTALEGLYVSRKAPDTQIVGSNVFTPAPFGQCVRGPTGAVKITSPAHFLQVYGGRDAGGGGTVTGKIWQALAGRQWCYPMVCARAVAAAAVAAHINLPQASPSADIVTVTASSKGAWANGDVSYGVTVDVVAASDGVGTHWDMLIHYQGGVVQRVQNIDTTTGHDNTLAALGNDPGNLVVLTKLANGRPDNATGIALASGSDGTIAASDYVSVLKAVAAHADSRIIFGCEQAVDQTGQTTVTGEMTTQAALYPMKLFLTSNGAYAAPATDITNKSTVVATKTRNLIYCSNQSWTYDPPSDSQMANMAQVDMASILCQTQPDIHPGDADNLQILAGVRKLTNESLNRDDLKSLLAAGISTLERTEDGFQFHSGVTTDGSQICDVRAEQYIVQSLANAWKYEVRKPFTQLRQDLMTAKADAFFGGLQKAETIVDKDSDTMGPAWSVAFNQTDQERSRNLGRVRVAIRTMPHLNNLVLEINIGTGVTTVVR